MTTKWVVAAIVGATVAAVAITSYGQTVYEPVKYQYGRYGEVFYGGVDPNVANLPQVVNTPAMQEMGERFQYASPGNRPVRFDVGRGSYRGTILPQLFTDMLPFIEVGRYGFTREDARNEAYLNVPRYQTMQTTVVPQVGATPVSLVPYGPVGSPVYQVVTPRGQQAPAAEQEEAQASAQRNPSKAVPLLNWARAERERNPALYRALLKEARKHDPETVDALDK